MGAVPISQLRKLKHVEPGLVLGRRGMRGAWPLLFREPRSAAGPSLPHTPGAHFITTCASPMQYSGSGQPIRSLQTYVNTFGIRDQSHLPIGGVHPYLPEAVEWIK